MMNYRKNNKGNINIFLTRLKKRYPILYRRKESFLKEQKSLNFLKKLHNHLEFLDCAYGLISNKDFNTSLLFSYTSLSDFDNETLIRVFSKSTKKLLMTYDVNDLKKYKQLPKEIIVYRGCTRDSIKRISWTLDKEWAIRRGHRIFEIGNKPTYLYQAKVKKKEIYCYSDFREENEIIVHPDKLQDIKKLKNLKNVRKEITTF